MAMFPVGLTGWFDTEDFEYRYQLFITGQESVRPLNEDIERVYLQMIRHIKTTCPHGKTLLTCGECNFSDGGWKR